MTSTDYASFDLHVHTVYSLDSIITIDDLKRVLRSGLLTHVGVTDHNTARGGLKARRELGGQIIAGMEISSCDGHVLILGIRDERENKHMVKLVGLSALEVIEEALDENLIVVIPHPFEPRRGGLRTEVVISILDRYGEVLMEVLNAASFSFFQRRALRTLSQIKHQIKPLASSDAHIPEAIGCAYTLALHPLKRPEDLPELLRSNVMLIPKGRSLSTRLRLKTVISQVTLKIRRLCYHL
ncbi:MAG: PHP domain-containing protein [Thermoprotei archaeon]|nr:PHP domain-containing protein [Thermoprotei archaeon]